MIKNKEEEYNQTLIIDHGLIIIYDWGGWDEVRKLLDNRIKVFSRLEPVHNPFKSKWKTSHPFQTIAKVFPLDLYCWYNNIP